MISPHGRTYQLGPRKMGGLLGAASPNLQSAPDQPAFAAAAGLPGLASGLSCRFDQEM
jgi:hypothetical protein